MSKSGISHVSASSRSPSSSRVRRAAIGALLAALLASCAGYSITYQGKGEGYDVYRPEPYLLVSYETDRTEAGAREHIIATARIIWLPNYLHPYRVHSWSSFGKADFKFEFADGWRLASIEDKSENVEFAGKLLDIIRSVVPLGEKPGALTLGAAPQPPASFELYRFEFDTTSGSVVGLKKLSR